jgi:hypothetical protein
MSTMSIALSRPAEIALVTADAVEELVEREFRALQELERAAVETRTRAGEYERHLMVECVDPAIASWMLIRVQQYIEQLRSEADDDTIALLASARRQAEMIRQGMLPAAPAAPATPAPEPALDVERRVTDLVVAPIPDAVVPAVADAGVVPAPVADPLAVVPVPQPVVAWPEPHEERPFWPLEAKRGRWRLSARPSKTLALEVGAALAFAAAVAVRFA